ncbi:MAG: hypothetical protein ABI462_13525 [Ignavibacteria bacterium]
MKKKLVRIKAIEIIKTFSKEEKKKFKLFLSSTYFNTNSNLCRLYNTILTNEKKILSEEITEKEIYQITFSKDSFSYSMIRNLMSSLLKMCEEFLVINSMKDTREYLFQNDLRLLNEYSKRFLDRSYELKHQKIDKSLDYASLGSKFFEYKFDLNLNLHNFDNLRSNFVNNKETLTRQSIYNICRVISILSEDVSISNYLQTALNLSPDIKPAVSFINNLNVGKFLEELKDLDELYFNHINNEIRFIKLVLCPEDINNYHELKKLIFKKINSYSDPEKIYHTSRLLIFLHRHYNSGNQKLIYEVSEIRKFQLKNIRYGKNGAPPLQLQVFVGITDIFLRVDGPEYLESFVKNYLKLVEPVNRENAMHYAMSRIEIEKKNYEKALEHLDKLELVNFHLKFSAKMLKIQAFYELKFFESGFAAIDALKHYMKSNKEFSNDIKNKYGYLLRLIEKVYVIRNNPEKYSLYEIERILNEAGEKIYIKNNWYNKKLEELKKHYHSKGRLYKTA